MSRLEGAREIRSAAFLMERNSDMAKSLKHILRQHPVEASAPCRIDAGGTWDIRALALPFDEEIPTTVNAAISLRTSVRLSPFEDGQVRISSRGFGKDVVYRLSSPSFQPPFGAYFAVISHFGLHGVDVRIRSEAPVRSSLGGSSAALVALIEALVAACRFEDGDIKHSREDTLHLGYAVEDAMSGGGCGVQDQAAAVFGGVHQWTWRFGCAKRPFERVRLLDAKGEQAFSQRMIVAFSGTGHASSQVNRKWVKGFLDGETTKGWIEANRIIRDLGQAIRDQDWPGAAALLRREMQIRRDLTPEALIPITARLLEEAEALGCGARFSGAGAGGCVWALGQRENIEDLKTRWSRFLSSVRGGSVLSCHVDPVGVCAR
jgi:D-glycero-alpha-D-manno-heptose-7-phosphate kinase